MSKHKMPRKAQLQMMSAVAAVASLQNTEHLPVDFYDQVIGAMLEAKSRLQDMARKYLGYAEGDVVTTPVPSREAKVKNFFVSSETGNLWVRASALEKNGSVGKTEYVFPASVKGVSKKTH